MSTLSSSLNTKILIAYGFVRRELYHHQLLPEIIHLIVQHFSDPIIITILSTPLPTGKQRNKSLSSIRSKIQQQCPSLLPATSTSHWFARSNSKSLINAQDILLVEYLSSKHRNYPLLIHLNDSVVRHFLNLWIQNNYQHTIHMNQSIASYFFDHQCTNEQFKQYMESHKQAQDILSIIKSAIASFQKRILPPFQYMPPVYKINSDPLEFSTYLFKIAGAIRFTANTSLIPCQVDFLLIHPKSANANKPGPDPKKCQGVGRLLDDLKNDEEDDEVSDYDTDDESDEDEEDMNKIPDDIEKLLKSNKKREYIVYEEKPSDLYWNRLCKDIQKIVGGTEVRRRRVIYILDRRSGDISGDKLYLFKPLKYYKFPAKTEKDLVHSSLHHHTTQLMCPKPDGKSHWNARHGLKGQMFVLSFHIMSKHEIRCYLFYQGQCFRFFGRDLINVMPLFFEDPNKVKQVYLKNYHHEPQWRHEFDKFCGTFKDFRFDSFYHGLTGYEARIDIKQK